MRIKDGFILQEVAESFVVVAVGERSKEFNGMVNLNTSGAFLWRELEKDTDRDTLIQALAGNYGISKASAQADVDRFIDMLKNNDFIEY